ncbi:MAG: dimethylarginine dimethylaminohydrolase family protein [Rudaea sp.]
MHPEPLAAQAQHAAYCQALCTAGLDVTVLPPDERYPDSCFVQDTALVIRGQVIVCRPGAPSRRGEEQATAAWLGENWPVKHIEPPGTLEGGDVMVLADRVLVGRSERTNAEGIEQLRAFLEPLGLPVLSVTVGDGLHLLSDGTYLGRGIVLAAPSFKGLAEVAGLQILPVPPAEAYAANALALGDHVIVPAGFPQTAARLKAAGFNVLAVPLSEFEKVDGGATCLSIVW